MKGNGFRCGECSATELAWYIAYIYSFIPLGLMLCSVHGRAIMVKW